MTVELEMMNEENGRLRRHIKTLEAELKKQDAAQAQAADLRGVSDTQGLPSLATPARTTGESSGHPTIQAAVEPVKGTQIVSTPVEPVCWGMLSVDGGIYDIITPEQHAHIEGKYTVPLYTSPPDRRVLQADGKHPAPCAKFCEATAFNIELRQAQQAMRLALECIYDHHHGKYLGPDSKAQRVAAIAALEKELNHGS